MKNQVRVVGDSRGGPRGTQYIGYAADGSVIDHRYNGKRMPTTKEEIERIRTLIFGDDK